MRRFAALLLTVPLAAQTPVGQWSFGVYGATPDLTGHYRDTGASPTDFDIKRDFKLKNDKTTFGVHMDYMGSRFAFSVNYGIQDFAGQNRIYGQIEVGGHVFDADMDVASSLKNTALDACGTIKILRGTSAWLGVDIAMQAWYLDVQAEGVTADGMDSEKVSKIYSVPIPQLGFSFGFQGLQNRLVLGAKAHFLAYSGAKYTRYAADARFFFTSRFGLRAFVETQSLDVPDSSIINKVEAKLDSDQSGFGVVIRW
jgi:hypothetical protein